MSQTWKEVARQLASRLVFNTPCDNADHDPPDPDCPFCADTLAVQAYYRRLRQDDR